MAKKATPADLSSSEFNEETTSSDDQEKTSTKRRSKRSSVKSYVSDILSKRESEDGQPVDLAQTEIRIDSSSDSYRNNDIASAFRHYPSNPEGNARTNAPRQQGRSTSSDEETGRELPTEHSGDADDSIAELNLDPNPVYEQRESAEQVYKQKVYLRQLQPPTPQPVEIQVQEVLINAQTDKPPIHVHVGHRAPRTPSPIIIKTAPPPPPPLSDTSQPVVYNKYVPPPKQPPQQVIIHRHPDMPPKPRPIIVEQWLPYKPAPKRIIKHSIPREALQTPPPPHNIIVAYSKPRAIIEVELVRLPVVKIDPQQYQQMTVNGSLDAMRYPQFQHEQQYFSRNRPARSATSSDQINWRI
ncbi:unnamed protein product [Adineta ricciae]|uniref:Uncharacterized protein n=1 Tax=Adineta ricciae TaxID=249248 RepID=A0A815LB66_ADIRI|nr:unnamed protein product [Adineta ricciae]CAF1549049.1 unnamed protein product [Adineta ricciae]